MSEFLTADGTFDNPDSATDGHGHVADGAVDTARAGRLPRAFP